MYWDPTGHFTMQQYMTAAARGVSPLVIEAEEDSELVRSMLLNGTSSVPEEKSLDYYKRKEYDFSQGTVPLSSNYMAFLGEIDAIHLNISAAQYVKDHPEVYDSYYTEEAKISNAKYAITKNPFYSISGSHVGDTVRQGKRMFAALMVLNSPTTSRSWAETGNTAQLVVTRDTYNLANQLAADFVLMGAGSFIGAGIGNTLKALKSIKSLDELMALRKGLQAESNSVTRVTNEASDSFQYGRNLTGRGKPIPTPSPKLSTVKVGESNSVGLTKHSLQAAESSELSYSSIIKKLREINTPEARATEKYIKRGYANLNFVNYSDKAGYVRWGTNDITIARNVKIDGKYYAQDLLSAAGTTGHESVHVMQKVAAGNHSKLHELDAFMWQRNIDTRLQKYTLEDLWNTINTHKAYIKEPFWNGLNKVDDLK